MSTIHSKVSLKIALEEGGSRQFPVKFTSEDRAGRALGSSQEPVILIGLNGRDLQLMTDLALIQYTMKVLPGLALAGVIRLPVCVNFGPVLCITLHEDFTEEAFAPSSAINLFF